MHNYYLAGVGHFRRQGDPYWLLSDILFPVVGEDGKVAVPHDRIVGLWRRLVELNPDSAYCHGTLGYALRLHERTVNGTEREKKMREELEAFSRAKELDQRYTHVTGFISALRERLGGGR